MFTKIKLKLKISTETFVVGVKLADAVLNALSDLNDGFRIPAARTRDTFAHIVQSATRTVLRAPDAASTFNKYLF